MDRAERYDLKLRLWLFLPLFFPAKKKREVEKVAKIVIFSHAFLLDPFDVMGKRNGLTQTRIMRYADEFDIPKFRITSNL